MKINTRVRSGLLSRNHTQKLVIKSHVKAGGKLIGGNHNSTVVRRGVKVNTSVKSGRPDLNHNQTLVCR